jgi:hypothetical protein
MAERGITKEAIAHVLGSYDVKAPSGKPGCVKYSGTYRGQRITVVVDETRNPPFVRTVY